MPEEYKVPSTCSNGILTAGDVGIQHINTTHVGIVFPDDVRAVNFSVLIVTQGKACPKSLGKIHF
jgi:hypothetical protein